MTQPGLRPEPKNEENHERRKRHENKTRENTVRDRPPRRPRQLDWPAISYETVFDSFFFRVFRFFRGFSLVVPLEIFAAREDFQFAQIAANHERSTARMTEEGKDRNMGTEISRARVPNSYFSVHIFLSDSSSSSNGLSGYAWYSAIGSGRRPGWAIREIGGPFMPGVPKLAIRAA